jgi:hypothetical protein
MDIYYGKASIPSRYNTLKVTCRDICNEIFKDGGGMNILTGQFIFI